MSNIPVDLQVRAKEKDSFLEGIRHSISWIAAIVLGSISLVSIPRGFENLTHEAMEMSGFLLLIIGGLGRIWSSIYIAGRKDKELCTSGPYSLCRNPLYLFSFIGMIGVFLGLQSLSLCSIAVCLFLIYYRIVITSEEARLERFFGDEFAAYCQTTPRFFPTFQDYRKVTEPLLTQPHVIERGIGEVFWFLSAIVSIEVLETVHHHGWLIWLRLPF